MRSADSTIPAVLESRARHQSDDIGFTFIDYEIDPNGYVDSLTYSDLYQRVQVVAHELLKHGSVGDRVAILAPQSLDYIVGFLGVLEAGLTAVPLSVPMFGVHDERVLGVLNDSAPVAVLTTSAAIDAVVPSVSAASCAPQVIEIDSLDFHTPAPPYESHRGQAKTAFLQYTSGSTRAPAGVIVTHENLTANLTQIREDYFEDTGGVPHPDTTLVSWLPFYHDMGLMLGVFGPIQYGFPAVLTSPMAFLAKPARWMQLVASNTRPVSPAPNFAYELAVRRTSDQDMAGLDLSHVFSLVTGAERIHSATLKRFTDRFARFNLPDTALRSAYGLAEATVYVASAMPAQRLPVARFSYDKLAAGIAERCEDESGVDLISHGPSRSCMFRIVDPETSIEKPDGEVGEIWVHGDNVSSGYWRNPEATKRTFGGRLVEPSSGTPEYPWLKTGDLGVIFEGDLFIVGRIKDLLIVDGRNHYPDDIEATIQEISGGRVAAVSISDNHSERLVAIVEFKSRGNSEQTAERIRSLKRDVSAAVSQSHGVRLSDLVLVAPGSIPITTSGKIRRSSCVDLYSQDKFLRLELNV